MTQEEYMSLYEKHTAGHRMPEEDKALKAFLDKLSFECPPWDDVAMGNKEELEQMILQRIQERISHLTIGQGKSAAAISHNVYGVRNKRNFFQA